ncbi:hypothetical protein GcC1_170019 [Golovinomyces cichoracearum]|uniref:Uncharacterized protein n=1 Tax=Golovinomyces cichoracearum TaxID=62708 RepID=A0A420HRH6_9PEZI|nr:hypothetical protein GcC1_170019 [Golovinomyces cichoracearum]
MPKHLGYNRGSSPFSSWNHSNLEQSLPFSLSLASIVYIKEALNMHNSAASRPEEFCILLDSLSNAISESYSCIVPV